jgi:DNA-binding MarR family transcriptional regulator
MQYQPETPGMIVITETGKQVLAQLWSIDECAEQAILACFSEDEQAQFRSYLKRIQDNCTRITKEDADK